PGFGPGRDAERFQRFAQLAASRQEVRKLPIQFHMVRRKIYRLSERILGLLLFAIQLLRRGEKPPRLKIPGRPFSSPDRMTFPLAVQLQTSGNASDLRIGELQTDR